MIGTVSPSEAREFPTDFGLTTPGNTASFKVEWWPWAFAAERHPRVAVGLQPTVEIVPTNTRCRGATIEAVNRRSATENAGRGLTGAMQRDKPLDQ